MSTDRKPTRNVTLAELQLADIATITGQIDRLSSSLIEATAQRDELLDAAKALVKWSWTMRHADREADVWKALDRAIARAEGVAGRK